MPARKGKREATKVEQPNEVAEQVEPPVKKSRATNDVEKKAVPKKKPVARGKKVEAKIEDIVEPEDAGVGSDEENNVEGKKSPKGKKKVPKIKKTTDKDNNIEKRETRGSKAKKEAEPTKVQNTASIKGKSAKTNQKSKK